MPHNKVKQLSDEELESQINIQMFRKITNDMVELYAKKNHDYGNAFGDTIKKAGFGYGVGVVMVKANRFATLAKTNAEVSDEKIEDTLLDIANYAIMNLIELKKQADCADLSTGED